MVVFMREKKKPWQFDELRLGPVEQQIRTGILAPEISPPVAAGLPPVDISTDR